MSNEPTPNTTEPSAPTMQTQELPKPAWLAEALRDWDKAKEAVSIDPLAGDHPANLNIELFDFPETISKWGFRVAEAVREFQFAELYAADCWAAAEEKVRQLLGPLSRGKTTTEDYKRAARRDEAWRDAEIKRIHAEAKVGRLKSVMAGLAAKREALMSLGANLRSEMQADPALRDNSRR